MIMKNTDVKKRTDDQNFGISIVAVSENGDNLGNTAATPFPEVPRRGEPGSVGKKKTASSKALPKDSKIQLKMLFPDKNGLNLVKAHGTVKWVKQVKSPEGKYFLIGVHFKEATKQEREKITKLWKTHRS